MHRRRREWLAPVRKKLFISRTANCAGINSDEKKRYITHINHGTGRLSRFSSNSQCVKMALRNVRCSPCFVPLQRRRLTAKLTGDRTLGRWIDQRGTAGKNNDSRRNRQRFTRRAPSVRPHREERSLGLIAFETYEIVRRSAVSIPRVSSSSLTFPSDVPPRLSDFLQAAIALRRYQNHPYHRVAARARARPRAKDTTRREKKHGCAPDSRPFRPVRRNLKGQTGPAASSSDKEDKGPVLGAPPRSDRRGGTKRSAAQEREGRRDQREMIYVHGRARARARAHASGRACTCA